MTTVTSPEALSTHKVLQLPATFAWSFDPGHLSTIGCCGDIDGDGRDEFIVCRTAIDTGRDDADEEAAIKPWIACLQGAVADIGIERLPSAARSITS